MNEKKFKISDFSIKQQRKMMMRLHVLIPLMLICMNYFVVGIEDDIKSTIYLLIISIIILEIIIFF